MDKEYLWQYVMQVNPFVREEDVRELTELNEWDLLIIFNDDTKILYDRCTGYYKNITYGDVNDLTEEQEKIELAYMLRSLMKRNFITQEELAAKANITQAMVSRYVRGEAMPNAITLNKIAKVIGCSMDDFFHKNY